MGAWGTGIWENDTACDIHSDFLDTLKRCDSKHDAINATVASWNDLDDELAVLALADLQIDYNSVALKANLLHAINLCETKPFLDDWQSSSEREKVLNKFLIKATEYMKRIKL